VHTRANKPAGRPAPASRHAQKALTSRAAVQALPNAHLHTPAGLRERAQRILAAAPALKSPQPLPNAHLHIPPSIRAKLPTQGS
jgi:hypothetical protein